MNRRALVRGNVILLLLIYVLASCSSENVQSNSRNHETIERISSVADAGDWNQYGHDSRKTSKSNYDGPDAPEYEWVWPTTTSSSSFFSFPVTNDDGELIFSDDRDIKYSVADDGTYLWGTPHTLFSYSHAGSPVVIDGGIVYSLSNTGGLTRAYYDSTSFPEYVHDWTFQITGMTQSQNLNLGTDGRVYVSTAPSASLYSNSVLAFDDSGLDWFYTFGSDALVNNSTHAPQPSGTSYSEGLVYIGVMESASTFKIHAIDASNGSIEYTSTEEYSINGIANGALISIDSDGNLYFNNNTGSGYKLVSLEFDLDERWIVDSNSGQIALGEIDNDEVVFLDTGVGIRAYNSDDGSGAWNSVSYYSSGSVIPGITVDASNRLYTINEDTLFIFDPATSSNYIYSEGLPGSYTYSSGPMTIDEFDSSSRIYVKTADGYMICFMDP